MDKELEKLARELVRTGHSAAEIRNIANQHLGEAEVKALWNIPRQNIINFVLDCFGNLDLKPPFLEVGCGRRSYRLEAVEKFGANILYVALDHYLPDDEVDPLRRPNLLAKVAFLPLSPLSVKTLICTEVLEHVENDDDVLKEFSRVLEENGLLIMTLPGADIPKHERPPYQIDYRRYRLDEVKRLLEANNFNLLQFERKTLFELEINLFVLAQKS